MKPVVISKQAEIDFEEIYNESKEVFGETVANKLFKKFCQFRDAVSYYPTLTVIITDRNPFENLFLQKVSWYCTGSQEKILK